MPIRPVDIARHWGTNRSYISMLRKRGMPEFEAFKDADAWRAAHAPARMHSPRVSSSVESDPEGEKSVLENNNNLRPRKAPVELIDTTQFLAAAGTDFDSLMIRQAEATTQIAHGLYVLACERQDVVVIAGALKNWNEAARHAYEVREKFRELQEKSRALISVDRAMDIVGRQLQALRLNLIRFGDRVAGDANPADPALSKRIVDAEVDRILARVTGTEEIARAEIFAA